MVGRDIDLQRIRKEHRITQQRLAELTKYPQSFISQIENRRVSAPAAFQRVLMKVLDLTTLDPYYLPTPSDEKAQIESNVRSEGLKDQQSTINRLLDIIDRRDERIRELEIEVKRLNDLLIKKIEN